MAESLLDDASQRCYGNRASSRPLPSSVRRRPCLASRHLVDGAGLVLVRHIAQGVDGLRSRACTVRSGGTGLALVRLVLFAVKSSGSERSSVSSSAAACARAFSFAAASFRIIRTATRSSSDNSRAAFPLQPLHAPLRVAHVPRERLFLTTQAALLPLQGVDALAQRVVGQGAHDGFLGRGHDREGAGFAVAAARDGPGPAEHGMTWPAPVRPAIRDGGASC